MNIRAYKKLLSALLLIPIAVFFLSCCCLKADASVVKKSSCASCPQQKNSNHQADCPHAKIRAVVDVQFIDLKLIKDSCVLALFLDTQNLNHSCFFVRPHSLVDTSQRYSSLFPQNPILRL